MLLYEKKNSNQTWCQSPRNPFVVENDNEPNGTDIKRDVHCHLEGSKDFQSIFQIRLNKEMLVKLELQVN